MPNAGLYIVRRKKITLNPAFEAEKERLLTQVGRLLQTKARAEASRPYGLGTGTQDRQARRRHPGQRPLRLRLRQVHRRQCDRRSGNGPARALAGKRHGHLRPHVVKSSGPSRRR